MSIGSSWSKGLADARQLNDAIRSPGGERLAHGLPLYARVPKDFHENLRYRRKWLAIANSGRAAQQSILEFCRRDILWYLNTWCWTYDPRKTPSAIPFITYEFQDEAILDLQSAIEKGEDRLIEKSRDMGASWLCIYALEHPWHFSPHMVNFRLVSRKEDLVDAPGDPDSLMWKLDFIHRHQPGWMQPPVVRTSLHKANELNGATIDGESTTGDAGRGGRSTADIYDEFASVPNGEEILAATADRTRCRIFPSTPKGQGNAYFRLKERGNIKVIRLHWSRHPEKAKNLYTSKGTQLVILQGEKLDGYPYILDGKLRSPWYDNECKRRTAMEVAQELDIDYLGSDYQFFDAAALDRIDKTLVMPPFRRGELRFDPLSLKVKSETPFADDPNGRLLLWTQLDTRGRLVGNTSSGGGRQWVIACDIAMGTGASNSTMSIGCKEIPEKLAEIACPRTTPQDWAELAIALASWLKGESNDDPEIIFEANGPGRLFGDRLYKREYPRVYWRTKDGRPDSKQLEMAGWWSTPETKLSLLGEYRRALVTGLFTLRSRRSIDEARQYVFRQGGTVEHSSAGNTPDPSGAKDNHGDITIADALLWHRIGKDLEAPAPRNTPREEGTFAERYNARRQALKREQEPSW